MIINQMSKMHGGGPVRAELVQHTVNSKVTTGAPFLTLTKPVAETINNGDLLIILIGNDMTTDTAQWDDTTHKPSGFTLVDTGGSTASAAHLAEFWRIADGTETTTIDVSSVNAADVVGWYIHIRGAHATAPIGAEGAVTITGNSTSQSIPGATGNEDDLGLFLSMWDGGDTYPFTVSGTGWVRDGQVQASTSSGVVAGCFGTKIYDSTAAQSVTVDGSVSDGKVGHQFRILAK